MSANAETVVQPPSSEDEDASSDEGTLADTHPAKAKEETGDGGEAQSVSDDGTPDEDVAADKPPPKKPPAGREGRKRKPPDRYEAPAAKKPTIKPAGGTTSKEAAAARRRSIHSSSQKKKPAKMKPLPDIPKGDLTAAEAGVSRVKPHISKQCI